MDNKTSSNSIAIRSLTRTPIGSVFVHDIKDIYSSLLYCLDLSDTNKSSNQSFLKLRITKKNYRFSFTVDRAVNTMQRLNINLQHSSTLSKISYEIKPKFAMELLQTFFSAKLLHCPEDKTAYKINNRNMILQPTPKGVAILHLFCQKVGVLYIKNLKLPEILKSNFNSMELICLERHSRSDSIIHNEYWDKLLFLKLMGPKMNIWSPTNKADEIKDLGLIFNTDVDYDCFSGRSNFLNNSSSYNSDTTFLEYLKQRQDEAAYLESNSCSNSDNNADNGTDSQSESTFNFKTNNNANKSISPFHHRFFTNPDSDSHIQYYVSNNGLRIFKNKIIEKHGKKLLVNYCFSGKAIIQYLMDCTDLIYQVEAIKVASFFLKLNLIQLQTLSTDTNRKNSKFIASKNALYTLTTEGYALVRWSPKPSNFINHSKCYTLTSVETISDEMDLELTSIDYSRPGSSLDQDHQSSEKTFKNQISLPDILHDPGLKYLFRQYLSENLCIENLDAYDEIIEFQKKISVLKKLVVLKNKEKLKYINKLETSKSDYELPLTPTTKRRKITVRTAIKKITEECLSKAYTIYVVYITDRSPNELNIDAKLKSEIDQLINKESNYSMISSSNSFLFDNKWNRKSSLQISRFSKKSQKSENDNSDNNDNNNNNINDIEIAVNTNVEVDTQVKIDENNKDIQNRDLKKEELTPKKVFEPAKKNTELLTLNLRTVRDTNRNIVSPIDVVLGPSIDFLNEISDFYNQLQRKVFKMMETDSLSKFLQSDLFNEIVTSLSYVGARKF